jgi:hypothetical protein
VTRRGGAGITFGGAGDGGGKGLAGDTVTGFAVGFVKGSSFLTSLVAGSTREAGFVAGFIPEQPNKKNRTEISIRIFGMEAFDKYFINCPLLFTSPS